MAMIGIDLGTTTSEACYSRDGKPQMIRNESGYEIILSVVGIDPKTKEVIVGKNAKGMLAAHPDDFVQEIKRQMGTDELIKMGNNKLSPEEISALILKYIKKYSEDMVHEEIDRAVITVPANFNDKQRRATKKAGELAGFKVERLVNEPTAAALAYGLDIKDNKYVMIYDLGGGTFDVTILAYVDHVLSVMASAGDNQLGGKDFDQALCDYVRDEFYKLHQVDLKDDLQTHYRVLSACEKAKIELSSRYSTEINISLIAVKDGKPVNLEMEITRPTLESLISAKIDKTAIAIHKALDAAKLKKEYVDTILLVGGSTRIPYVKNLVEWVMGMTPKSEIDPERAVAMGAAVQASIIDGASDTIISDVVPLSLGIVARKPVGGAWGRHWVEGLYDEIIPANSTMMEEFKKTYYTSYGNQHAVEVKVCQKDSLNDSIYAADHTFLGGVRIEGIPPAPVGKETITVTFLHDLNGILNVRAVIDSTSDETEFTVKIDTDMEVTGKNIEDIWEKSEKAARVKTTIQIAEKRLKEIREHAELEAKVQQLKGAVLQENDDKISKLDDEINELLFELD